MHTLPAELYVGLRSFHFEPVHPQLQARQSYVKPPKIFWQGRSKPGFHFFVLPLPREMIQFDKYFQLGCNHHLETAFGWPWPSTMS